ncbi:MAG: hypothetical protein IKD75_06145 [Prevotella sp.]|nr:hypothetical protein [Prevotella sp.]
MLLLRTYEKIETIYNRDIDGSKKLLEGDWRNPTVEFLKDLDWVWTEKTDGTNVRIFWDGYGISFGGRTDKASMPVPLVNRLNELFSNETSMQMFEQFFGQKEVILFGEGYGQKIQACGSRYIPDGVDFILFDVLIGDNYQPRETVEQVAQSFGLKVIPIVGVGPLEEAVWFVKQKPHSRIAKDETLVMEGVVCRPKVELRDRCGNRLIVKIKGRDFE